MFLTSDFSKRYEKLPVKIFNEQKEASKVIVRDVMVQAKKKAAEGKNLVLALAASSACLQVYDDFIAAVKEKKMSFKNIEVFGMDDYYPLDRNELQSHYRFLKECLLDDVDIPAKNVHFIDSSKRDNTEEYCQSYEKEIEKAGGIDIVITGNILTPFM